MNVTTNHRVKQRATAHAAHVWQGVVEVAGGHWRVGHATLADEPALGLGVDQRKTAWSVSARSGIRAGNWGWARDGQGAPVAKSWLADAAKAHVVARLVVLQLLLGLWERDVVVAEVDEGWAASVRQGVVGRGRVPAVRS
jgi:hypothetical protein